jgi:hypothetical protein
MSKPLVAYLPIVSAGAPIRAAPPGVTIMPYRACYADIGITAIMPTSGLCRVGVVLPGFPSRRRIVARHNITEFRGEHRHRVETHPSLIARRRLPRLSGMGG